MAFESGAMSFRVYLVHRGLPDDAIDRFSRHAASPIDSVGEEELRGWITGRHLLDRNITEETAMRGQYLFLAMQQAQRKIPSSLLKAECQMEELAILAADNKPFLNRQERAEVKQMVSERLMPAMPPQIKGTHMVYRPGSLFLYAAALPAKLNDIFTALFLQTQEVNLLPLTPDLAALERSNSDSRNWNPVSFSPDLPSDLMDINVGRDFLTWLWFYSEARGGMFTLDDYEPVSIMLEGPLLFTHEGDGAYETLLRKGEPMNSTESKTCLMVGKKLKQANLTFACGDEIWTFTLDADEFIFRNVKIPKIEEFLDAISNFEERMRRMERLVDMFFVIFDQFVQERAEARNWAAIKDGIDNWVQNRIARI